MKKILLILILLLLFSCKNSKTNSPSEQETPKEVTSKSIVLVENSQDTLACMSMIAPPDEKTIFVDANKVQYKQVDNVIYESVAGQAYFVPNMVCSKATDSACNIALLGGGCSSLLNFDFILTYEGVKKFISIYKTDSSGKAKYSVLEKYFVSRELMPGTNEALIIVIHVDQDGNRRIDFWQKSKHTLNDYAVTLLSISKNQELLYANNDLGFSIDKDLIFRGKINDIDLILQLYEK